jgi:hypothetical protein
MTQHRDAWWSKEAGNPIDRSMPRSASKSVKVLSLRKILRFAIVLTMSFLCWIGIGCFAFEMMQLAAH